MTSLHAPLVCMCQSCQSGRYRILAEHPAWQVPRDRMQTREQCRARLARTGWTLDLDQMHAQVSRGMALPSLEAPPATWRIHTAPTLYGCSLDVTVQLDVDSLERAPLYDHPFAEANERHFGWLVDLVRSGVTPPPATLLETDQGNLRVIEGQLWLLANLEAGRPEVRGWVNPSASIAFSGGATLHTGLTHEMAILYAQAAGHPIPEPVLRGYPHLDRLRRDMGLAASPALESEIDYECDCHPL